MNRKKDENIIWNTLQTRRCWKGLTELYNKEATEKKRIVAEGRGEGRSSRGGLNDDGWMQQA